MSRLKQAWFRWVDRELDKATTFPDRDSMQQGEWNRWVGESGERLAGKALWREGFKVLYRNFQPKEGGEVDLVCREGDVLVFTEVKTRTSEDFGRPADAVNRAKQTLIIRGANAWLRELHHPEVIFRFDIVEVLLKDGEPPGIQIIREAFVTPQVGLGM